MDKNGQLIHGPNTMEFFRNKIQDAISHKHVETSDMAEFYLVNLLDEYCASSSLFSVEGEGPVMKPLALLLKQAVESDSLKKKQHLKRLGDTALYVAGFFADYINKSIVSLDYYISMGGSAYGALAELTRQKAVSALYLELAIKFAILVDVLAEVAPWSQHLNNRRLIEIYARWLKNGDERLRQILEQEGIDTSGNLHMINP